MDAQNKINELISFKPSLKLIGATFVSSFGLMWLFIEPLNGFGVGDKFLTNLGIWGYLIIFFISLLISSCAELIRIYVKADKSKTLIVQEINDIITENTKITLLTDAHAVIAANIEIVDKAEKLLAVTGSRSRDMEYLNRIEHKLMAFPKVVHYRVLWGDPHTSILKTHLLALIKIRNPASRDLGQQMLFIGLFDNMFTEPEKFVCVNEKMALVVLPSVNGISHYDTALLITDETLVNGMIHYVKELYSASKPIETDKIIRSLRILRKQTMDKRGL